MSNVHRVQQIFIGDGSAIPSGGTNINPTNVLTGDLAIAGINMKQIATSATVADTESIFIVEGRAGSKLKRSMEIPGKRITSYKGTSFTPGTREVWSIGYSRKTATGSITVVNDRDYNFSIRPLHDKQLYSERILKRSLNFVSAVAATQLSVGTQIASAINSDEVLKTIVTAVLVGDGTGAYGLTGATNYGVEITAKDLVQFSSNVSQEDKVYFTVELDGTNSGFGVTPVNKIQGMTVGKGTLYQVSLKERQNLANDGVLNFTKWPIPVQTYSVGTSLITSSNVSGVTGNVTVTNGLDRASVATSTTILRPGETIDVNGIQYEIKYVISSTEFILTSPATATYTGANIKVKYAYDSIVIEFSNPNMLQGPGLMQDNLQSVCICFPAIDAGDAYTDTSAQGGAIITTLNAYCASLGFANLSL